MSERPESRRGGSSTDPPFPSASAKKQKASPREALDIGNLDAALAERGHSRGLCRLPRRSLLEILVDARGLAGLL
jgi:hypothetical protein